MRGHRNNQTKTKLRYKFGLSILNHCEREHISIKEHFYEQFRPFSKVNNNRDIFTVLPAKSVMFC